MTGDAQRGVSFAEAPLLMHRMIRGTMTATEAARRLGVPRDRLAFYRDLVRHHCRTILEKNYSVLCELVEPKLWERLVDGYYEQYPFDDLELNGNAAQFPRFIWESRPAADSGMSEFFGELAEVEWKEFVTFSAEVCVPPPGTLSEFTVNPSLIALQLVYPIGRFLREWRLSTRESRPPVPTPDEGVVFVFRHPASELASSLQATDTERLIVKMLVDGIPRSAVLTQTGLSEEQLDAQMNRLAESGVLCR